MNMPDKLIDDCTTCRDTGRIQMAPGKVIIYCPREGCQAALKARGLDARLEALAGGQTRLIPQDEWDINTKKKRRDGGPL